MKTLEDSTANQFCASLKLFTFMILAFALFTMVTALGFSEKNPQQNLLQENGMSTTETTHLQADRANAAQTQSQPGTTPRESAKFQVSMNISCPNEPPICSGGMLPLTATIDQVNSYWTKNNLTVPLTCRFQQPPRCRLGKTSNCTQRCTP